MTGESADPLLSVIIPAYNAERYLANAITCVLAQSENEIEIIVVNDGSADNTVGICRQFSDRIRYIEQANQGVSEARNKGIEASKSKWVAWLDADDFWLPTYWSHLKPILLSDIQFNVLCFGWAYATEAGDIIGKEFIPERGNIDLVEILYSNKILSHSAVTRREDILKIGGFDPKLTYAEDWDVWNRLALSGNTFQRLSVPLVVYRQRSNSLSKNLENAREQGQIVIDKAFSYDLLPQEVRLMHDSARGLFLVKIASSELERGNLKATLRDLEEAFSISPELLFDEQVYFALASCKQPTYYWGTGIGIELTHQYDTVFSIIQSTISEIEVSGYDKRTAFATLNLVFLKIAYYQHSRVHMLRYWIKLIAVKPELLGSLGTFRWLARIVIGKPRNLGLVAI